MTYTSAIFLGIIQGLTEFIPVSSSGHLVLFRRVFGIEEAPLLLDTLLHAGTLVAAVAALRKDLASMLRRPFQRLTLQLAVATVPAVVAAILLKDPVEEIFATGKFLEWGFLSTAAVLFLSERAFRRRVTVRSTEEATIADASAIGLLQGFAILPAVSRSGLTIAGALFRGWDRSFAARFSFLLSIPAILGAVVFQIPDFAEALRAGGIPGPVLAGSLTAAIVGFLAVTGMVRLIRERSLRGFSVYLAVLGALVFLDRHVIHMFF